MCSWNINNNISFHFRLFPRKTIITKFFKKSIKPYFWGHSGPSLPKFGQKWIFLEKRALPVFQYSNYLPLCQKSVKPSEPFLRKLLNGHTKNQFIPLISSWDTPNFRVLWLIEKSDWPRAFSAISHEPESSQIWNLFKHTTITVS